MIQKHSIILWKNAENSTTTFEEISRQTFVFIENLKKISQFSCLYINKAANIYEELPNTFDSFCSLLKSNVNQENGQIFEDLGYYISFVTKKDKAVNFSVDLHIGNRDAHFVNTCVINIPIDMDLSSVENTTFIKKLFSMLVNQFKPFWGCVSNKIIARKYGRHLNGRFPVTVQWINFWQEEIIGDLLKDKLIRIQAEFPEFEMKRNIIIAKKMPFNMENESDIFYQENLHKLIFNKQ